MGVRRDEMKIEHIKNAWVLVKEIIATRGLTIFKMMTAKHKFIY